MNALSNSIEKRLNELDERLLRLESLRENSLNDFLTDPFLRDIAERNFEVAIQCCIDIANRVLALHGIQPPNEARYAFLKLAELDILPPDFAKQLMPMAGFRNILAHEYLDINWNIVYSFFQSLDDFKRFGALLRAWLSQTH